MLAAGWGSDKGGGGGEGEVRVGETSASSLTDSGLCQTTYWCRSLCDTLLTNTTYFCDLP